MTDKIITLDDHFSTGEPTIQLVSTWGRGGRILRENTSVHKIASIRSPALDYIKDIDPEPGKTTVLVIGLGDHETYGPNRNGDGFPSEPVRGKIASDEVLTKHYQSYKNAHVFRHHVNSDPAKAIGKVKMAFWNPYMHRVEVVEDFDHSKAPDLLEKIADGEFPAKSMGCRIKYDVCTICGNKAKTRADYCDHLKYEMGKIDGTTGKQAAALNPSPNFFDSSYVIRPADRTGFMLKKVAYAHPYEIRSSFELAEKVSSLKEKAAELGKAADIEKVLDGKIEASKSNLDDKDVDLLDQYKDKMLSGASKGKKPSGIRSISIMISHSPGDVAETTEGLGAPMCMSDLLRYFMGKMAPGTECSDSAVKSANMHVPFILDTLAQYPRFSEEMSKVGNLDGGQFNHKLATELTTGDYLKRNYLPAALRPQESPRTMMHTYTDPITGQQYKTTQHDVDRTHDALSERAYKIKAMKAAPLLGGSAVLGGLSLAKSFQGKAGRKAAILSGLGSAATGALGLREIIKPGKLAGPAVRTDQGKPISGWTEMVRTASDTAPEVSYMIKRAVDKPAEQLPAAYISDLTKQIKTAEIFDDDANILGPTLDLDQVAKTIGDSIIRWMP